MRQDHGADIANRLARQLVVPPQRDGGQAQYIDAPMPALDSSNLFADTVAWMQEHLDEPVTVEDLAAPGGDEPSDVRPSVSLRAPAPPRTSGCSTSAVQFAQRLLETTAIPIELVAEKSGLCTAANLRKHFQRLVHTSPHAYRRTFRDRRLPG